MNGIFCPISGFEMSAHDNCVTSIALGVNFESKMFDSELRKKVVIFFSRYA